MKKVLYIILCMSFVASCNSKNEKTENYIIRNLKGIIREVSIIGSGKAGERTIFLKEEKMKFIKKIVFSINKILIEKDMEKLITHLNEKINVTGMGGDEDYMMQKKSIVQDLKSKRRIYKVLFQKSEKVGNSENTISNYQFLIRELTNNSNDIEFGIAQNLDKENTFSFYLATKSGVNRGYFAITFSINGNWKIKGIHSFGL